MCIRDRLNFAVKNLDKLKKSLDLAQALVDTQDYVTQRKPDEAIEFLANRLTEIRKPRLKLIQSFKERSEIRVEEYRQRSIYGIKGIEPPWPTLKEWFNVWENGTLNVYSGISGTGKCLEENTLIEIPDGSRRTIREVVENKLDIYSIDPDTGEVSAKTPTDWIYSGEKECFEVTFKTGDKIVASKDHPILTDEGWVKIESLNQELIVARVWNLPNGKGLCENYESDNSESKSSDIFWDRVKSIKSVGIRKTYDLSVDTNHSFAANYTWVHNSWTCAYFSKYVAFDLNKKVLLITMENDKSSLDMRTAAIYYGIPFFDLRTGQIDLRAYNNWLDDTSLQSERGDVFIYDRGDVKNVLDIQSLIYKHQPDMTIIDAAYLIDHSGKKYSQGFDNQKQLVEEMMDVARDTDIPWLATNQLNESVLSMDNLRNAGFRTRGSKAWHHSPATSINGFITPEDALMGTISMAIGKNREGAGGAGEVFKIATDHQRMTFIEVEEYVDQEILDDLI